MFKQWTPYFLMPLADMRAPESWSRIATHPSVPGKLTPLSFEASTPAQQTLAGLVRLLLTTFDRSSQIVKVAAIQLE